MATANPQQMNQFVATVDEFFRKYAKLISPQTRSEIYASNDPALISDYESTVNKSRILKSSIETTVGAWNAAKRGWISVTDTTSMYIGDAIDALKNLFGAGPDTKGLNSLGVIQIPAAVFVVGAIGASAALILSIDRIFILLEANKIQRDSPGTSRQDAYAQAKSGVGLDLLPDINKFAVIAGIAFIAYLYFGDKK